ncbi:hypothetical protein INT50_13095 [Vibrio diabolicus]|uniref:hypothetical protein n=1 Tax=Vibrio harveyi group TaxID=717610 RepID=UPI00112052DA|nr:MULTISPECIES: hypothetical protein [Vibrio harveyi group]EHH2556236.1 hypothetical protein [Vibrio parahaemolyticus]EJG1824261.1 hypothetical protein [Vibrio parahaemolyticus]ELA9213394.1 hypothetical protein [Vibrio parahaemolyticus]ELB2229597.1 hypothetical protein [Vibrio parahaemolyticus]MEA5371994.1 hypothetical protein [Vibrio parahaemolyticus]
MKEKQYNIDQVTVIIKFNNEENDNNVDDLSTFKSEKCSTPDINLGVEEKWYKKYISPFTLYQAFIGAAFGIFLALIFL